ncbi:hypothetical protein CJ030_MR6G026884 [Morella rubra]|uniref:Uncharacterized protein n=1 Tax=Morella rubra TaxID=262757 RepID=A0A6A1VAH0_9ROSI|nr:hypothetical protein CJ030_MR6G026884 [Morella rubra]
MGKNKEGFGRKKNKGQVLELTCLKKETGKKIKIEPTEPCRVSRARTGCLSLSDLAHSYHLDLRKIYLDRSL